MATNVIEKLLVSIEANAAQLQAELAKGGTAVQSFGKQTDQIAKGADGIGQRYSQAAVQIASAAENMARAGKVGGGGLKQIITQGANMAFMFGPQGAVVGAVGIASLAIIEIFRNTENETRQVVDEVRRLAQAARGAQFEAASGRLTTLDRDIARIRGEIEKLEQKRDGTNFESKRANASRAIATLEEELGQRQADRDAAQVQLQAETQRLQAEELRNLQALIRANKASTDESSRARAIESALRNELTRTNLTLQRRVEVLGLLGDLERTPKPKTEKDDTAEQVAAANKALDSLRQKREANAEAIRTALTGATRDLASLAGDAVAVLTQQIDEATAKFRALGATDAEIARIVAPLEAARKAAVGLTGAARTITIPESSRRELASFPQAIAEGTSDAASKSVQLADGFADVLNTAAGLATAIGGANDGMTRLISGAAQAAQGFAQLAGLAAEAGGIGALFSSGAGAASAIPALGAVVAGLGGVLSLVGREDPAARALRESLDRTAARLEELNSSVGELVQISVGGEDAAAVRDLVLTRPQEVGRDDLTGEPIIRDVALGGRELLESLRQVGVSLKELQQLASDFGVTFANPDLPTAEEIRGLQLLISANGLKKLTDSLAGQLKLLELEARIDPAAFEGIAGVIRRIAVLTGERGVPALAAALDGIDLSTADGPAQAIARLKQLLADFTAGDIDLSALGDLNPEEFAEAITSLIESIRNAAPALRTPGDKFAAAIEAFGVAVELGTLTAEQKLAKAADLFATLFPELAAGVDTSSLEGFRSSIASIIDGFAADGDLSEAEQAQIAVLRALLEAFEGATPAAAKLADALSVLEDRFAIFGTTAADQITALLAEVTEGLSGREAILKNASYGLLQGLTEGLDLATKEGQSELRRRAQAIFESLAEGGITAEEQAVVDLLKRILGLAVDVVSEAERAAADAARAAEEEAARRRQGRAGVLEGAETEIGLRDIDDPVERLRVRLAAVAEAFPELAAVLEGFDLSTQEGRDALEAWIEQIAGSPEALEQLATAMGVSVDELLSALLGLESSADAAAEKVLTLADRLGAAFDEAEFTAELEGITDPLERLRRAAAAAGGVLPELAAIFKEFNLDTAEGRAGAEAALIALGKSTTDAAVRSAVLKLLSQIRGVPAGGSGGTLGAIGGGDSAASRANVQAANTITEVTGNRLVDLFLRNVVATEGMRAVLEAGFARSLAVPPPLVPPALPSLLPGAASGGASAGAVQLQVNLPPIVFNGPVTTADAEGLSRLVQQRFLELVQGGLATELLVALRRAGVARSN